MGGKTGQAVVKRAEKYADRATNAQLAAGELTTPVLDAAYPGLVKALAQHEGIGIVFAVVGVVLRALFLGAAFTIQSLMLELGL